mgnify:CR=1 FL=1
MVDDAAPSFGAQLKRYRLAANLSQEALAEAAGLSARAIRALERGERITPYRDTLDLLATALRLTSAQRAQLDAVVARRRGPRAPTVGDSARPGPPLPAALTSFVGREQEVDALKALLCQQPVRLVTLTGPGGVGKTRLAFQVANAVADRYVDGVWLVELAALTDPALVPGTVAAAFGVREVPGQSLVSTLAAALRSKRLLLLLDNCEHLVDACARLVDTLLRACPLVQVLATSREALGIDGEVGRRVPSLAVPPADALPPGDQLIRYEAVRLFLDRAGAVQAGFTLTAQNASAVADICRRLDGIPLALEMAAARLAALSVEHLAERLDQRFKLLTGGSRAALPRQQTLRATLDWSYDLLIEPEQRLFTRLSVFAGGWTLAAAEEVGGGGHPGAPEVLDLLARLMEQSLVAMDVLPDGAERYRMLETVRQYGRGRLAAGSEAEEVYSRHAAHYARLAEEALWESLPPGFTATSWLLSLLPNRLFWLEPEYDNLRLALDWLVGRQAIQQIIPVLVGLCNLWVRRGAGGEGRRRCGAVLALPRLAQPRGERAILLGLAGHLAFVMGAYDEARRYHEEGVAVRQLVGDQLGVATCLDQLGIISREQGDLARAQELLEQALALRRQLGEQLGVVGTVIRLGEVAHVRGDVVQAQAYYEEGLRGARRHQISLGIGRALHHLGALALDQQAPAVARERFLESLAVHRREDHRHWFQYVLADFAELAAAEGQAERALRLGGATSAWVALGHPIQPSELGRFERWMETARRDLIEEAAAAAWAEGEALALEQALDYALAEDA